MGACGAVRFRWWILVCLLFIPAALRADSLSPPEAANWRQKVENSVSGGDYQPVLDLYRQLSNTSQAQEFYTLAEQICTDTVTARPGSEEAFYAQKTLLFLQINNKNPAASATLDGLRAGFSEHPGFVTTLREAADRYYYYTDQTSRARDLYQQVLSQTTGNQAMLAQRGLAMTNLRLGDTSGAESALNKILTDYSDHPQIALAVKEIANAYFYYTEDPLLACALYQRILTDWPDSSEAMAAYGGLAMTHLRLANYADAESALQTLLSEYSDHDGIAAAVKEIANAYLYYANDPAEARALYQRILRDWPDSFEAMAAQRGLALTALELGDKTAARMAAEKLLSDYSNHPRIALAVRELADRYFYVGQDPAAAAALYERILADWPGSPEAMAAQRGLAMAKINLGDSASGDAAADKLLSDFAAQPDLDVKTAEVFHQYCRAGRTADVIAMAGRILNQNPNRAMALTAQAGLAQAYAQQGQEENAREQISIILANYQEEKRFGYSLFVIGEEYFLRGEQFISQGKAQEGRQALTRAIEIWAPVRAQAADTLHQTHANYYSAAACQKIGRFEEAITYFQRVVDQRSAYEKAWYAQFMIARCSEELAGQDKLPLESVRAAYQRVIDKYPDSSAAKLAAEKISNL